MAFMFFQTLLIIVSIGYLHADDSDGVQEATLCEVCRILAEELQLRLDETGKSKEVIETGHGLDTKKKKKYNFSELRLIEALQEPNICDRILEYSVHKEKTGIERFAKGRSQTMEALHGLVNKGVKVELGMPHEMWDKPSVEITQMQRKCYALVEEYDEDIEDWYYNHQDQPFLDYFCRNLVLNPQNNECLDEDMRSQNEGSSSEMKGDKGKKEEL
ncbi:hypothetical protein LOTGIDRAFT_204607 [Lottia gigantea]|uniref:DUF3456 domain-containing protein n=1 Tax=Lottia gigantea TaxID=225164 RepID=V3ZXV7_LOTGI|nr:hypothetical protein LOTGIDRAFT_204607 [Lottia gigantea]ESO85821.1 hypothetical protein LOTGIDRAFT_204607 [Lottia gigantea]